MKETYCPACVETAKVHKKDNTLTSGYMQCPYCRSKYSFKTIDPSNTEVMTYSPNGNDTVLDKLNTIEVAAKGIMYGTGSTTHSYSIGDKIVNKVSEIKSLLYDIPTGVCDFCKGKGGSKYNGKKGIQGYDICPYCRK